MALAATTTIATTNVFAEETEGLETQSVTQVETTETQEAESTETQVVEISNADKIVRLKAQEQVLESKIKATENKLDKQKEESKKSLATTDAYKATAVADFSNISVMVNADTPENLEKEITSYKVQKTAVESQRISLEKVEQRIAEEKAAKEKAEKEAAEKAAREKAEAERVAAEKAAAEKAAAEAAAKETAIEQAANNAVVTPSSVTPVQHATNGTYPVGQCTWGAKTLAPWAGDYWGNGGQWADSARAAGFRVGTTPVAGAIIVWTDGGYGHVAYVTDVQSETSIRVQESNYNGNMYIADYRGWFNPIGIQGQVSYIYPN